MRLVHGHFQSLSALPLLWCYVWLCNILSSKKTKQRGKSLPNVGKDLGLLNNRIKIKTWQYRALLQDGQDLPFVVGQFSWFGLDVVPLGHTLSPHWPAHLQWQRTTEVTEHQFLKTNWSLVWQSTKHNSWKMNWTLIKFNCDTFSLLYTSNHFKSTTFVTLSWLNLYLSIKRTIILHQLLLMGKKEFESIGNLNYLHLESSRY